MLFELYGLACISKCWQSVSRTIGELASAEKFRRIGYSSSFSTLLVIYIDIPRVAVLEIVGDEIKGDGCFELQKIGQPKGLLELAMVFDFVLQLFVDHQCGQKFFALEF